MCAAPDSGMLGTGARYPEGIHRLRKPIMTSINFGVVLGSVVVFAVVMVLVHIHALFEQRASYGADGEPPATTTEPNRRNQSATPPKVMAGPATS